ncbi:helix-turn-helix domain-containing protein [Streptomyces griseoviridis]|uniref:Peptidoglycan/LPS O-acetylase OafA/YrhL n=1 Tax=Streptomyces griseoviridis TaxID=45398 RepID=A0ABT9LN72_STRGD|nr:peptidoglycan/LPS O-acetylase OafA/YrhL [Streptomyces griseoviridis]
MPGLRREEVAELAGVSADYYARIEQGRNPSVSDSVLMAIARALQLDELERNYLVQLARPATLGPRPQEILRPQRVRNEAHQMLGVLICLVLPAPFSVSALPLVPLALVIRLVAARDAQGLSSRLRGRALIRLGKWSYAFYLVHLTILAVLFHVWSGGW